MLNRKTHYLSDSGTREMRCAASARRSRSGIFVVDGILQTLNEPVEIDLDAVGLHADADLVANAVSFLLCLGLQRGFSRKNMRRCQQQIA